MNDQDRQAIDGLFAKLDEAERRTGPRDAQAEGYIAQRIAQQPAAPYLMAQTIVMQDYALQQAQTRIEELERQAQEAAAQYAQPAPEPAPSGGLFGGLFGSSQPPVRRGPVPSVPRAGGAFNEAPMGNPAIPAGASSAWQSGAQPAGQLGYPQGQPGAFGQPAGQPPGRPGFGGGGFLAGAAQTAVGVAGGVLLGNALAGMFGGSEAKAAEAPTEPPAEPAHNDGNAADTGADDASSADDGGWFDGGGWFGGDDSI